MCFNICATINRAPFRRHQYDRIRRWVSYYAISLHASIFVPHTLCRNMYMLCTFTVQII